MSEPFLAAVWTCDDTGDIAFYKVGSREDLRQAGGWTRECVVAFPTAAAPVSRASGVAAVSDDVCGRVAASMGIPQEFVVKTFGHHIRAALAASIFSGES